MNETGTVVHAHQFKHVKCILQKFHGLDVLNFFLSDGYAKLQDSKCKGGWIYDWIVCLIDGQADG